MLENDRTKSELVILSFQPPRFMYKHAQTLL